MEYYTVFKGIRLFFFLSSHSLSALFDLFFPIITLSIDIRDKYIHCGYVVVQLEVHSDRKIQNMPQETIKITSSSDKQTFVVKNPSNGKIIAFINFGNDVSADVANGLTSAQMEELVGKCQIEKFTKSEKGEALEGLL